MKNATEMNEPFDVINNGNIVEPENSENLDSQQPLPGSNKI